MSKIISSVTLSNTLWLVECKDGFWLYDETRGMNLAIRENSPTAAFVKSLTYYQERLTRIEKEYKDIKEKVDTFVKQVIDPDDYSEES